MAAGKTTITASFAQGSSSVQGSTDLTVTSTVAVNRSWQGDGIVVFQGVGGVMVDGRSIAVSGLASLTLPAGVHTFRGGNGRRTLAMVLEDGEVAISRFRI